jgi:leucyl/phenylalanyl-tRNA--protein transferase
VTIVALPADFSAISHCSIMARPQYFLPPELADEHGVVRVGGSLSPDWLLHAYGNGIFPWPHGHNPSLLLWFSPDPRAIFEMDGLHVSRSLRRTLRSGRFEVTTDCAFSQVIRACAVVGDRSEGTWITPEMILAFELLHREGVAHSVEAWQQGELVGGVYGVALGGVFAAESMFYHANDASKVALVHLMGHLRARGYQLFDIQQLTEHTARLGAIEISRVKYLQRLKKAVRAPASWGSRLEFAPW